MIYKTLNKLKTLHKIQKNKRLAKGKTKYFCIGRNKTGTTSLEKAFRDLGYPVGHQSTAELLADRFYFDNNFVPIIRYCESAQVFQDAPFSLPETFKHIDRAYPGSKFILTIRNDAEQWHHSITQFHARLFGKDARVPTTEDLKRAKYVSDSFVYKNIKLHGTPDDDPYNKEIMIAHYHRYNQSVIDYFKDRPNDLLVINLAEQGSYQNFVRFLGIDSPYDDFPWENRT